ncbi:MAG: HipA domain-containing protein [Candidatus Margulisbacteria bacterium]|nr:HipA domain-containing protein [Candidatus Margulisiibacteriota bacterium]
MSTFNKQPMVTKTLFVFFNQHLSGNLKIHSDGELIFQYDPSWLLNNDASPLSILLPLQSNQYKGHRVNAYFGNLLPGNTRMNEIKIFSLLEKFNANYGAVSIRNVSEYRKISLPNKRCIKYHGPDLPDGVENEAFCMRLGNAVGLSVPETTIINTSPRHIYVGRETKLNDTVHEENLNQLLGIWDTKKPIKTYQLYKTFLECSQAPIVDKWRYIQWIVFNFLIGNKNPNPKSVHFSHTQNGVSLSYFTDLISTEVYPKMICKHPFYVGGEQDIKNVRGQHWKAFAKEFNIKPASIVAIGKSLINQVQTSLQSLDSAFLIAYPKTSIIDHIASVIEANCIKVWESLAEIDQEKIEVMI